MAAIGAQKSWNFWVGFRLVGVGDDAYYHVKEGSAIGSGGSFETMTKIREFMLANPRIYRDVTPVQFYIF